MAGRKTRDITLGDEYMRDAGKAFRITEMPAAQAEKWAYRCFLGFMASGIEVPEDVAAQGIAGIASLGFKALMGIRWQTAEPLLDEMWECVSVLPDPKGKPDFIRKPIDEDIEEVGSRIFLRGEVYDLHTGFSLSESLSNLMALMQSALANSQNIEMSHERSEPSSLQDSLPTSS